MRWLDWMKNLHFVDYHSAFSIRVAIRCTRGCCILRLLSIFLLYISWLCSEFLREDLGFFDYFCRKIFFVSFMSQLTVLMVGMREYSTQRIWTMSNYSLVLELSTRHFKLFNIIQTTRPKSNGSKSSNCSNHIGLIYFIELFKSNRAILI